MEKLTNKLSEKYFYAIIFLFAEESLKMKGIVIYDSSYGNTKKIAETIAETLKESEIKVDLSYVKKAKLDGKDYEFIIVGSPTKWGTMSFTMKRFLGKIKSDEWANKPFAAFDTELPDNIEKTETENKNWSAAEKIAEKLADKNMKQIIPVLKAVVLDKKGPLKDGEIERTKDYTKELVIKLKKEK